MLKQSLILAISSLALATILVSPAIAAPADSIGTWVNKDSNTRRVTRLVITSAGDELNIQVFGQCHPQDCDWGTVPLVTYRVNFQDTNHSYSSVNYNQNFANRFLTFGHAGKEILFQGYTQFLDNSNRPKLLLP